MDKRQTGIIATVVTALLCGCPGLFAFCWGSMAVVISFMPGAEIDVLGSSDPASATTMGIVFLCLSIIFIAIPIAVGFFMLRRKPEAMPASDEPLPPAS